MERLRDRKLQTTTASWRIEEWLTQAQEGDEKLLFRVQSRSLYQASVLGGIPQGQAIGGGQQHRQGKGEGRGARGGDSDIKKHVINAQQKHYYKRIKSSRKAAT